MITKYHCYNLKYDTRILLKSMHRNFHEQIKKLILKNKLKSVKLIFKNIKIIFLIYDPVLEKSLSLSLFLFFLIKNIATSNTPTIIAIPLLRMFFCY